jgi:glycosyltransferase involved in cell wall biosynthesis
MNTPINLVIPTRDRAETLFWALKSCLIQDYPAYKIWVSDNCSEDNTAEVVKSFNDPRITYLKTPQRISMAANWEFALEHIADGYVIFIGDDDGLIPGSLTPLAELIGKTGALAVRPYPVNYYWPNAALEELSGVLTYFSDNSYWFADTGRMLDFIGSSISYFPDLLLLPSLYYGATDISVIKKIRQRDGRFFHSPLPDVYSAVIIAAEIDKYIFSHFQVCIGGTSKYSTGQALSSTNVPALEKEKKLFFSEEKNLLDKRLETPQSRQTFHPPGIIAAEPFLKAREKNKRVPEIDLKSLIRKIILRDSGTFPYEACINAALIIAGINGLEEFARELIEKNKAEKQLVFEPENPNFQSEKLIAINTSGMDINNVFEAGLYVAGLKENARPVFSPPDLVVNPENSQYFKREFMLNYCPERAPSEAVETVSGLNFFIRYRWSAEPVNHQGYFIFMPVDNSLVITGEVVSQINKTADQVWLPPAAKNEYSAAGVFADKIRVIPETGKQEPEKTFAFILAEIAELKQKPVLRFNKDYYFYETALLKMANGNFSEAINDFSQALKINPENFYYSESLARCLEKAGDTETAAIYYKKAAELKKKTI